MTFKQEPDLRQLGKNIKAYFTYYHSLFHCEATKILETLKVETQF